MSAQWDGGIVLVLSSSCYLPELVLTVPLSLSYRSPLLNQARPSPQGSKSQPVPQGWRSKGYRCIGGVMYRVSANKLSKTSSTPGRGRDLSTKSPGRAGEQREFLLVRTENRRGPGFVPTLAFSRSSPGCASAARRLPVVRCNARGKGSASRREVFWGKK